MLANSGYAAVESTISQGPIGWSLSIGGAVYLALVVTALYSISHSPGPRLPLKLLWALAVVALPVLGAVLWFALGKRRQPSRR